MADPGSVRALHRLSKELVNEATVTRGMLSLNNSRAGPEMLPIVNKRAMHPARVPAGLTSATETHENHIRRLHPACTVTGRR